MLLVMSLERNNAGSMPASSAVFDALAYRHKKRPVNTGLLEICKKKIT
jgi:hypothetical protein